MADSTPITWRCGCSSEGTGFMPDWCDNDCTSQPQLTRDGMVAVIRAYRTVKQAAEYAANALDYGFDTIDFDMVGDDPAENATFEVSWTSYRHGDTEHHDAQIPLRLLWSPDEAPAIKAAAEQAKVEAKRQREIADATARVRRAEVAAQTAQMHAQADLERAKAALAALTKT